LVWLPVVVADRVDKSTLKGNETSPTVERPSAFFCFGTRPGGSCASSHLDHWPILKKMFAKKVKSQLALGNIGDILACVEERSASGALPAGRFMLIW
jgi:hypothetical protein